MADHTLISSDDFQPLADWSEDTENHYLIVHLPEFKKEQISITCVRSTRIIRLQGQRQLANYRWSRFNQSYTIPQNCILDKIQAKWQNEIISITMPKEIVTPPPVSASKDEAKTPQQAQKTKQEQSPPKGASSSYNTDGKRQADELLKAQKPEKKETGDQKGQDKTSPQLPQVGSTSKKSDDREMLKADRSVEQTSKDFTKGTAAGSEKGLKGKKHKSGDKNLKERKAVKEMAMENNKEERQAMVNMGVAILVLVAFGAYVSYTIASKAKEN
ncbi:inactive protein RESTRICTED TEV MOVEMENT 2-like [Pistacia vera]|uniref:inactive protein RESTRICTED TEV MOVEMENT 2-like n=1 Tax=Pistacia vera TaxID=55513 RepID=UPI001263AD40|nr:inactive protein RESTRICTED TEV MOVEMENT 2-like [Pistacia vera]